MKTFSRRKRKKGEGQAEFPGHVLRLFNMCVASINDGADYVPVDSTCYVCDSSEDERADLVVCSMCQLVAHSSCVRRVAASSLLSERESDHVADDISFPACLTEVLRGDLGALSACSLCKSWAT